MKAKQVFGGHIYLLSNFGVARNPLYKADEDVQVFKELLEKYLSEICEIHAYSHQYNQFQYLVKIKERPYLENFFFNKRSEKSLRKKKIEAHSIYDLTAEVAPESYLIFSQEVSNCLNAYAKKYNFKYKRKGGLFGDRYQKYLIETDAEFEEWKTKLNNCEELVFFEEEWQVSDSKEAAYDFENKDGECSSKVYYGEGESGRECSFFTNFLVVMKNNLVGFFDCLPPLSTKSSNYAKKYAEFKK